MIIRNLGTFMFLIVLMATCCQTIDLSIFGKFKFRCSTAMLCVDEVMCDQFGVISKVPIVLTETEELFRHPLLPCNKKEGGDGVCCRDPDFKDDWPANWVDPVYKPWSPKPTVPTPATTRRPGVTRPVQTQSIPSQVTAPGLIRLKSTVPLVVDPKPLIFLPVEPKPAPEATQGRSRNIDIRVYPESPSDSVSESTKSVGSSGTITVVKESNETPRPNSTVLAKDSYEARNVYIEPSKSNTVVIGMKGNSNSFTPKTASAKIEQIPLEPLRIVVPNTPSNIPPYVKEISNTAKVTVSNDGSRHNSGFISSYKSVTSPSSVEIQTEFIPDVLIIPTTTTPSPDGSTTFQDRRYLPTGSAIPEAATEVPFIFLGPEIDGPGLDARKSSKDIINFFATAGPEISAINPVTDRVGVYISRPIQPSILFESKTYSSTPQVPTPTVTRNSYSSINNKIQNKVEQNVQIPIPTPTSQTEDPCTFKGSSGSYEFKFSSTNCQKNVPKIIMKTPETSSTKLEIKPKKNKEQITVAVVSDTQSEPTKVVGGIRYPVISTEFPSETSVAVETKDSDEEFYDPDILPILLTGCPRRNRVRKLKLL